MLLITAVSLERSVLADRACRSWTVRGVCVPSVERKGHKLPAAFISAAVVHRPLGGSPTWARARVRGHRNYSLSSKAEQVTPYHPPAVGVATESSPKSTNETLVLTTVVAAHRTVAVDYFTPEHAICFEAPTNPRFTV